LDQSKKPTSGEEDGRIEWDSIPAAENGKDPAPVTVHLAPPTNLKDRLLDPETGKPIAKATRSWCPAWLAPIPLNER